jgi:hypothetical protein
MVDQGLHANFGKNRLAGMERQRDSSKKVAIFKWVGEKPSTRASEDTWEKCVILGEYERNGTLSKNVKYKDLGAKLVQVTDVATKLLIFIL